MLRDLTATSPGPWVGSLLNFPPLEALEQLLRGKLVPAGRKEGIRGAGGRELDERRKRGQNGEEAEGKMGRRLGGKAEC